MDESISNLSLPFINYERCESIPEFLPYFYGEDISVHYLLYTRDNPYDPCDLQPNVEALKKCHFDPKRETKVIIHGWTAKFPSNDTKLIFKDEFLQVGDYNVVIFIWTDYNQIDQISIGYVISASFTPLIGLKIAVWINFLEKNAGASPKLFHLLPHSLGSAAASFAAKLTCNLAHITYLDPAGIIFKHLPRFLRPAYTDADFVEAVHTDGSRNGSREFGLLLPVADIDYYVNGGAMQPKCHYGALFNYTYGSNSVHSSITQTSCNHYAALDYYMASFNKGCNFLGLICNSYDDFKDGKCTPDNSAICKISYDTKQIPGIRPNTKCFVSTSDQYPFCLGRAGLMPTS